MRKPRNRLRLLSFFIVISALLLVSRLYVVQIVSGQNFEAKAGRQYTAGTNYFDRGSIYFTTKEGTLIPAANIKLGFVVHLNPNILNQRDDLEEIYMTINSIIPISKEDFLAKAKKKNDPYEELAGRLTVDVAEKIRALKISGLNVTQERWRAYPGGGMTAHVIGLIGYLDNELAGRYGLERFYEPVLRRSKDSVFVNFFAEIFSNMKKVTEKYTSDFTGGIVINPKTGEIFAMAFTPTFDPNFPQQEKNSAVFRNRSVEDRYEMGSIIKALTLAAGLDSGAITAKSTYNDPGCMTLNTRTFCNYDGKSHGSGLSMQTVLNKSLNTGAAFVTSRMGNLNFSNAMLAFGLDTTTGIDLPNEGKTLVSNLKTSRDLELAQASFGQGIALTPINTLRALSALANGGTLITT